jgi:predicted TIM-barrel fold metal-dependent hydrolase
MKRRVAVLATIATLSSGTSKAADVVPVVDHHQHLFSPTLAALLKGPDGPGPSSLTAADLTAHLDAAGIRRAVVLSAGYIFASPSRNVEDAYAKVRAENDWVGAQVALYPQRLRAFCGLNPLSDYALDELARCAKDPNLRHGLKLHFGNSDVQLENPEHAAQVRRVFQAAGERGMAIVVHTRASLSKKRPRTFADRTFSRPTWPTDCTDRSTCAPARRRRIRRP